MLVCLRVWILRKKKYFLFILMRCKECRLKNQQGKNGSTIKISTTVYEIIYLWNLSYSAWSSVRKRVLFVPIFMWLTYHVDVICLPTLWIHMLIRLQKVPNWSVRKRVRLHATMTLFAIHSTWMNVKFLSIFAWGVCRVAQPLSFFFAVLIINGVMRLQIFYL